MRPDAIPDSNAVPIAQLLQFKQWPAVYNDDITRVRVIGQLPAPPQPVFVYAGKLPFPGPGK